MTVTPSPRLALSQPFAKKPPMLRNHARLAAAVLTASLVLPLAACATGGKKTKADTQ